MKIGRVGREEPSFQHRDTKPIHSGDSVQKGRVEEVIVFKALKCFKNEIIKHTVSDTKRRSDII